MSKANVQIARSKIGTVYIKGCSEFVSEVLGKGFSATENWTRGAAVEKKDLSAGDVVGWGGNGVKGHVCIWDGSVYLNCPGPGSAVKENNSMGQQLYRMKHPN